MNCTHCKTPNDTESNYCKKCGTELTLDALVTHNKRDRDIIILLIYIGWHFVTLLVYTYLSKFIIPDLATSGRANEITEVYKIADWVTSGIDALMLIIMLFLFQNKYAKILCSIYLVLRIGLMVMY